jgi:hypothetical protein
MSAGRVARGFLAVVVIGIAAVATLPTIWDDGLSNLETYLGIPKDVGQIVLITLVAIIVVVPAVVRTRRWIRNRRQHKAARIEAVRRLQA